VGLIRQDEVLSADYWLLRRMVALFRQQRRAAMGRKWHF
jgi:hypothetical protein